MATIFSDGGAFIVRTVVDHEGETPRVRFDLLDKDGWAVHNLNHDACGALGGALIGFALTQYPDMYVGFTSEILQLMTRWNDQRAIRSVTEPPRADPV